ncbi:MAG TPA: roadblock/LC7 domain-containing protein [Actinomycetota bacterium]|nr:roadblock/LC7 domain-containing protein [Actinomycetota bacterium]
MSTADQLADALDRFLEMSPETEAAAVVSADGLPMASALPVHVEEDKLAAMSAALLTLGERAADGLGRGTLGQVFVEGADGYMILMSAGSDAVLVAITSKRAKVGLVLYEMRQAADDIAKQMTRRDFVPEPPRAEVTPAERAIEDATPSFSATAEHLVTPAASVTALDRDPSSLPPWQ